MKGRMAKAAAVLGCEFPIIQGGMTLIGTARLAAAVSAAGGLGLVSAGRMTADEFGREIDGARALTRRPVGVNIPVTRNSEWMRDAIQAALEREVSAIVLGGGNPAPWSGPVVDSGAALILVVSEPRQAEKAQRLGASAVVAEGAEAGGKNGVEELGGLSLIPMVAQAVDIPVFAAGGIVDGRTAAAAMCLGAGGIQMGTRFMLSEESPLHERTKAHLTGAQRSTVLIGRRHGLMRRSLRNPASEEVMQCEGEASMETMQRLLSGERSWHGLREGDVQNGLISVGQGVALIRDLPSVAQIIRTLVRDMSEVLGDCAAEATAFASGTTLDAGA